MRRAAAISILAVIGALPAPAAELPSRKAGLWEVTMNFENRNMPARVVQQCIDAATDQMMQSGAGSSTQAACAKRDVQRSGSTITIDATCTVGGKTTNSHSVISGSFDSAYTMTVTSDGETIPGGKMSMTLAAKWLGPCTGDQKPGDMIMGNGIKINILDMKKRGAPPGAPLPR
jgi:hypothetical protein